MRKILCLLVIMISLNGISQTKAPLKKTTTTEVNSDQKVVSKNLYTTKEKEKIYKNFYKDVEKLNLSPEVKAKYLNIVKSTDTKLKYINHDKSRTRGQIKASTDKIINDQNLKIKSLLTFEQYQNHLIMFKRLQEGQRSKIEKSK